MRIKKVLPLVLILIGLVVGGIVCVAPVRAQTQQNITINADGTITPKTTTLQQTDNVYTLINKIDGSITVDRNNTVLDGKGFTLLGEGIYDSGTITLNGVSNVTVKNFVIPFNNQQTIGISLVNTSDCEVTNNDVIRFDSIQAWNGGYYTGIYVLGGKSNVITENTLVYNLNGIEIVNSSFNQIAGNNVTGGFTYLFSNGISISDASNNSIYHNNFVNSTFQFRSSGSFNFWDDGYPNGGNYWGDYQTKHPNAGQIGNSGIGNMAYVIDGQNMDRYPLIKPFNAALYELQTVPPKIVILSPTNQTYTNSSVPLIFTIDKAANWFAYSLDGKQNVTITDNGTLSNITDGFNKITVYGNDTFGDIGASTMVFKVAATKPFLSVTIAIVLGTAAVAVIAGLIVYLKKFRR